MKDIDIPAYQRIKVVNKYKHSSTDNDIYIGRGSIFGNPYSTRPSKTDQVKEIVGDREEAIEKYKEYFEQKMADCGCKHNQFKARIRQMVVELKMGGEINLVCYCKPKACHGDVIRDYILTQV